VLFWGITRTGRGQRLSAEAGAKKMDSTPPPRPPPILVHAKHSLTFSFSVGNLVLQRHQRSLHADIENRYPWYFTRHVTLGWLIHTSVCCLLSQDIKDGSYPQHACFHFDSGSEEAVSWEGGLGNVLLSATTQGAPKQEHQRSA
jgi:hypothetical protein